MTEIPDDIMEMAERALYAVHADEDPAFGSRIIASALLAAEKRGEERERERWAKDIANLLEMIRVRNAALEDWENGRIGQ